MTARLYQTLIVLFLISAVGFRKTAGASFYPGLNYGNARLGMQGIGLAQPPDDAVTGHLFGPSALLEAGRWTASVSGYFGGYSFGFAEYKGFVKGEDGRVLTDMWGDAFVFLRQNLKSPGRWIHAEGRLAYRLHPLFSLTANGIYRRYTRPEQPVTAALYTVDPANYAWYGEAEIETVLPAYKNEGAFAGGGGTFEIAVFGSPVSLDGSAALLAPLDRDQDLRTVWDAGVSWNSPGGFVLRIGYRDERNAHDPARERIRGFGLALQYNVL
ncbi:MAG TPA: hypothetical protein ENN17_10335 [bacterium]|nr:hypothetical protein [bacterium]